MTDNVIQFKKVPEPIDDTPESVKDFLSHVIDVEINEDTVGAVIILEDKSKGFSVFRMNQSDSQLLWYSEILRRDATAHFD